MRKAFAVTGSVGRSRRRGAFGRHAVVTRRVGRRRAAGDGRGRVLNRTDVRQVAACLDGHDLGFVGQTLANCGPNASMIGAISPQSRPDLTALGSAIGWMRSTEHIAEALDLVDQLSHGLRRHVGPPRGPSPAIRRC